MRIPYAATVLIRQVQERHKRAKAEPVGDPDGFRVQRSIRFDKTSSKSLKPLLEVLDDPRIESLEDDGGALVVTFVATSRADRRDPFPLEAAAIVLDG